MRASRVSHSTASNGCVSGVVNSRLVDSADPGAVSWGVVGCVIGFIGLPPLLRRGTYACSTRFKIGRAEHLFGLAGRRGLNPHFTRIHAEFQGLNRSRGNGLRRAKPILLPVLPHESENS